VKGRYLITDGTSHNKGQYRRRVRDEKKSVVLGWGEKNTWRSPRVKAKECDPCGPCAPYNGADGGEQESRKNLRRPNKAKNPPALAPSTVTVALAAR